ncbi:MAG: purine-nucleoside phosphorylase [Bdellovibrionales bacterium]|nr:purine-nucleoside phosphorylase [Bdellovibrionales bacterium]
MSENWMERIREAEEALKKRVPDFPKIVVVLGSGLGSVLKAMEVEAEIAYPEIPYFKASTVVGHAGKLVVGKLGNTRILGMQGRYHFYEGYSMAEVVFPYRVFGHLGAGGFLVTNAAGGVHADMAPRDLVLIRDHINMMGNNPLIGKNLEMLGPRFPDMTRAYDPEFCEAILSVAREKRIRLREGVYMGILGPSYETPSEIRMYRNLGADVVGMSTVPEVIAINHMGKRVAAISCVTNLAAGVGAAPLNHDEVLSATEHGHAEFADLVAGFVAQMAALI